MKKDFLFTSEVSVLINETAEQILQKVNKLLNLGFNMVAFSDRARADSNVMTIGDLISTNIFTKINSDYLLPILATRTKHPEEIDQIAENLKKQNVKNLFIVTGDQQEAMEHHQKSSRTSFLTSLDVIPKLAKDFTVGAAVHADVTSINRDLKKIDAGAKFVIVQACYDTNKWTEWVKKAMELGIHKKVQIYQTIIPLTNKVILENMHALHDVNLPDELYNELSTFDEVKLKEYGLTRAISQIKEVKQNSFFSGVYIYCRDLETMSQISSATFSRG